MGAKEINTLQLCENINSSLSLTVELIKAGEYYFAEQLLTKAMNDWYYLSGLFEGGKLSKYGLAPFLLQFLSSTAEEMLVLLSFIIKRKDGSLKAEYAAVDADLSEGKITEEEAIRRKESLDKELREGIEKEAPRLADYAKLSGDKLFIELPEPEPEQVVSVTVKRAKKKKAEEVAPPAPAAPAVPPVKVTAPPTPVTAPAAPAPTPPPAPAPAVPPAPPTPTWSVVTAMPRWLSEDLWTLWQEDRIKKEEYNALIARLKEKPKKGEKLSVLGFEFARYNPGGWEIVGEEEFEKQFWGGPLEYITPVPIVTKKAVPGFAPPGYKTERIFLGTAKTADEVMELHSKGDEMLKELEKEPDKKPSGVVDEKSKENPNWFNIYVEYYVKTG